MADLIDLVNLVRIRNLEDARVAGTQRADLRDRVEYMRERYGVNIPNLYQFNQENPPRQPDGFLVRAAKGALTGVIIGGLLGAAAMGATALLTGGALTFTIFGASGLSAIGLAAAGGAAILGFASLFEDQAPIIQQEQTIKYENYLNAVESELSSSTPARQQTQQPVTTEVPSSRRFQDMVEASRAATQQQR
jgi:hypothetical protein